MSRQETLIFLFVCLFICFGFFFLRPKWYCKEFILKPLVVGESKGRMSESNSPVLSPSQAYLQQAQDLVILESIILQTLGEL